MNRSLLDKVVALAYADEDIRAVILEGSLAVQFQVDELSDYDVNIYTRNAEKYLVDDRWLSQIGRVILYQKEKFQFYEDIVPTRLVLFRNRERIDFSFWRLTILADIVRGEKTYESYKNGYQVLVDKDHLATQLPPPDGTGFSLSPPTRERFRQTIYDFWFEAYCVARYLARRDLWYAKLIENRYIKDHLFRMALWNHQTENEWAPDPILHTEGKRFEKWAPAELIESVTRCFSLYDVDGTWQSLFAMVGLFNQLARQTSLRLQIEYPDRVEEEIVDYLQYLKGCSDNRGDMSR
jgi:aminoglycoside 6-adenylyltransferase